MLLAEQNRESAYRYFDDAFCVYHRPDSEENIINMLSSYHYSCEVNPYYWCPPGLMKYGAPHLRHGIVRAYKY